MAKMNLRTVALRCGVKGRMQVAGHKQQVII